MEQPALQQEDPQPDADIEAIPPMIPANNKYTTYPHTPDDRSYHGPTATEIGTDAFQEGVDRSRTRCIIRWKSLSWRWKLSLLVAVAGFVMSIIIANSCSFIVITRTYNDEEFTTMKFGRGVVRGQLEPTDQCQEWWEYDNIHVGARMNAARVGAIGCVASGAIAILLLLKDAFCRDVMCKLVSKCFTSRMWKLLTVAIFVVAVVLQALAPLMVLGSLCQVVQGDGGSYVDSCSHDTRAFTLSFVVMGLFTANSILVMLT